MVRPVPSAIALAVLAGTLLGCAGERIVQRANDFGPVVVDGAEWSDTDFGPGLPPEEELGTIRPVSHSVTERGVTERRAPDLEYTPIEEWLEGPDDRGPGPDELRLPDELPLPFDPTLPTDAPSPLGERAGVRGASRSIDTPIRTRAAPRPVPATTRTVDERDDVAANDVPRTNHTIWDGPAEPSRTAAHSLPLPYDDPPPVTEEAVEPTVWDDAAPVPQRLQIPEPDPTADGPPPIATPFDPAYDPAYDSPYLEPAPACATCPPIFGAGGEEFCPEPCRLVEADRCWWGPCSPWKKLFPSEPCCGQCDIGIARTRLPFAPFEIESAQPGNNLTLRYDAAWGMNRPDRSEYFWARQGDSPPIPETELDYQHFWLIREIGGDRFSLTTEVPIRFLNPELNDNTAGLGDIRLTPKVVLVDGRDWQFSHVFRTHMSTAPKRKGLGTGHTSLEPGFLWRYKWTEDTHLHAQLKFWFPIAGHPDHAGPTLIYGFGWGTALVDCDTFAIIGTFEMTGVSYLDGQATTSTGLLVYPDGETSLNVQSGARMVLGPAGDLGVFELGLSAAHAMTIRSQYDNALRLDLRWSY